MRQGCRFELDNNKQESAVGEQVNRKSVIATLKAVCSEADWLVSVEHKDVIIKHIAIFKRPYDRQTIGITENGFWCVSNDGNIWEFTEEKHAYVFYLLLYTPLKQIIQLIKDGLKLKKLPSKIIVTFPFDELILLAIKSSFWCHLAMNWVEEGYPLNDEMKLALCHHDKQSRLWLKWQKERLSGILGI